MVRTMPNPDPGWYPDPQAAAGRYRWWDGQRWTDKVHEPPGYDAQQHAAVFDVDEERNDDWLDRSTFTDESHHFDPRAAAEAAQRRWEDYEHEHEAEHSELDGEFDPLDEFFAETFSSTLSLWPRMAALTIPVGLIVVAAVYFLATTAFTGSDGVVVFDGPTTLVLAVAPMFVTAFITAVAHRWAAYWITDSDRAFGDAIIASGMPTLRVVGWQIVLSILAVLALFPTMLIFGFLAVFGSWGGVLAFLAMLIYAAVRLAFFLPAASLAPSGTNPITLSINLTAGQFIPLAIRLGIVGALGAVLAALPGWVISAVPLGDSVSAAVVVAGAGLVLLATFSFSVSFAAAAMTSLYLQADGPFDGK